MEKLNSLIGETLMNADYCHERNPDKIVLLWASTFHRLLNGIMRSGQLSKCPNTMNFVNQFLDYFETNGTTKDVLIQNGYTYLFRGLTEDFDIPSKGYHDAAFISTTLSIKVAKNFMVNDNGSLLIFDINKMDPSYKFIMIDDSINTSYQENEILLPPGYIKTISSDISNRKIFECSYQMDKELIELCRNHKTKTIQKGGSNTKFCLDCPDDMTFAHKIAIYYRTINGKPLQIITYLPLGEDENYAFNYFQTKAIPYRDELQSMENKINGITIDTSIRLAIYNRKTHHVEIQDFGLPKAFINEFFPHAIDIIQTLENEIHNKYYWLKEETRTLESLEPGLQEVVKELLSTFRV